MNTGKFKSFPGSLGIKGITLPPEAPTPAAGITHKFLRSPRAGLHVSRSLGTRMACGGCPPSASPTLPGGAEQPSAKPVHPLLGSHSADGSLLLCHMHGSGAGSPLELYLLRAPAREASLSGENLSLSGDPVWSFHRPWALKSQLYSLGLPVACVTVGPPLSWYTYVPKDAGALRERWCPWCSPVSGRRTRLSPGVPPLHPSFHLRREGSL